RVCFVPKNRHLEGNGIISLYSGEYITDNGFVGMHDLTDMVLVRNIFPDEVEIERESINNRACCIHAGNRPDPVLICSIQEFYILFASLIQINYRVQFRQS